MGTLIDITGKKFGRLTAIKAVGTNVHGAMQWLCLCDCGNHYTAIGGNLRSGNTVSCGCWLRGRYRHGHAKNEKRSPTYIAWNNMRVRCNNPNNPQFKDYGGRGITVYEHWNDFENFLADVGERPARGLTIERMDNERGYEPGNVTWASRKEQANNQRPFQRYAFRGPHGYFIRQRRISSSSK